MVSLASPNQFRDLDLPKKTNFILTYKRLPRRRQRLIFAIFCLALLASAAYVILTALNDNLQFFKTPSELHAQPIFNKSLRLGGYVENGSLRKNGLEYKFVVTDFEHEIAVEYSGFLPSLFREGQGVVAIGKLEQSMVFAADKILAKHDEKYMPPEIAGKINSPSKN